MEAYLAIGLQDRIMHVLKRMMPSSTPASPLNHNGKARIALSNRNHLQQGKRHQPAAKLQLLRAATHAHPTETVMYLLDGAHGSWLKGYEQQTSFLTASDNVICSVRRRNAGANGDALNGQSYTAAYS